MQAYDQTPRDTRDPFAADATTGHDAAIVAALNAEFTVRWNGWHGKGFAYNTGELMSLDDAIKAFQDEVAGRMGV